MHHGGGSDPPANPYPDPGISLTKVSQLQLAPLIDEQVLGLQVPVQDLAAVAVGQAPEQLEHVNLSKRGDMRSLVGLGPMWETLPLFVRLERNGDQNKSLGRLPDSVAHPVGHSGPVDTRESHMGKSSGMKRRLEQSLDMNRESRVRVPWMGVYVLGS